MLPASGTAGDPSSGVHWKASRRWKLLCSMEARNGRRAEPSSRRRQGGQLGHGPGRNLPLPVSSATRRRVRGPPGGAFLAASTEQRRARDQARTFPTQTARQPPKQIRRPAVADERKLPQRQQREDDKRADQAGNFPTRPVHRPLQQARRPAGLLPRGTFLTTAARGSRPPIRRETSQPNRRAGRRAEAPARREAGSSAPH